MARSLLRSSEVRVCLCAPAGPMSSVRLSFVHIDVLRRLPGYIGDTGTYMHTLTVLHSSQGTSLAHGQDELKQAIYEINHHLCLV